MKELILQVLKESTGYVSGEAISEKLGVSRTAVWKHIAELRNDGYCIDSSTKKGYMLKHTEDILNRHEISCGLDTVKIGKNVCFFKEAASTNLEAKKLAAEGSEDGTVVVAEQQTAGKGRLGREWSSMSKKGIWMSVILKPAMQPQDVQLITLAASVAVVNAIKMSTDIDTGIKWPNDIILDGRKACGILTEMSSEMDRVNYIVLGIGINVNQDEEDFPSDLKEKAVSLKMHAAGQENMAFGSRDNILFSRSRIISNLLRELDSLYIDMCERHTDRIISMWKDLSVTLGSQVRVIIGNSEYRGIAQDITPDGKLVVKCDDGVTREALSGEISIRGIMGYV